MSPLPLRLRLGLRDALLVSPRDVLQVRDRETATALVEASGLEPAQADAMVEALLAGAHVAIRVDTPTRMLDAPQVRPLVDPTDPVVDDERRPTWISLEVTHAAGISTEGVEVHVSAADGHDRFGRLGPGGRWRCDDVARGTCTVAILDQAALRVRPRVVDTTEIGAGQVAWELGKTRTLELAATTHHRIHVTLPRSFRFSV